MAAPADYLDTNDLKNVASGGLVREDVLEQIFDCSEIPTVFLDMIGTGSFDNPYSEVTEDKLAAPSLTNRKVSGSDIVSTDNDASVANAKRSGNHAQISTKEVMVTERAQATDQIGRSDEMGYQTSRRLIELRYDVEAISLSGQASVADDNNATPGQSAGAAAIITTNKNLGAGGAVAGFNTGTKLTPAQTPGEGRALTWTMVGDQIEATYMLGASPTILMSHPGVTKRLSTYLMTTPQSAKPTANISGQGEGVAQTWQGYVDTFKTDFGTLMQIIPNRLQQSYADAAGGTVQTVANVFGLSPEYWELALLYGWKVEALGKTGLSHRKMLHVDWLLRSKLERANFLIADINTTAAVTA